MQERQPFQTAPLPTQQYLEEIHSDEKPCLENPAYGERCTVARVRDDDAGPRGRRVHDLAAADVEADVTGVAYEVTGLCIR